MNEHEDPNVTGDQISEGWSTPDTGSAPDLGETPDTGSVPAVNETESVPAEENEYHFTRDSIYSDAHYTSVDESTEPPRYYTPPVKEEKPEKPKKEKKDRKWIKIVAIALVCAILGSLGGAAIVGSMLNDRIDELNSKVSELQDSSASMGAALEEAKAEKAAEEAEMAAVSNSAGMDANDIYDMACNQTVGISTDYEVTGFFGQTRPAKVTGSGFIISEDGYIVTNYHVVEYADKYGYNMTVTLFDGTEYEAKIAGTEGDNDLAIVKIEATGLTPATLGESSSIRVGDTVYAVGNPLGDLTFTMTTGTVTALNREVTTSEYSGSIEMLQIDAAVNEGNSGGPLYNKEGKVIGVVSAKSSGTGIEGIGFAIPIDDVTRIADDLMTKGYVSGKAAMGITINNDQNVISAMQSMYNMPDGAFVYGVNPGSAAEKAGIEKGDVITKMGETEIKSYSDLTSALKDYSAGDSASVTVYRSGEYLELSITFDEYQSTIGSNAQEEEEDQEAEGYGFGNDFFQFPFGN